MKNIESELKSFQTLSKLDSLMIKLFPRNFKVVGSAEVTEIRVPEGLDWGALTIGDDRHPYQMEAILPVEEISKYKIGQRLTLIAREMRAVLWQSLTLRTDYFFGDKNLLEGKELSEDKLIPALLVNEPKEE